MLDSRFTPPIFITLILLIGNLSFGILESYQKTLLAIVTAIAAEMVLGRIFLRKWPHPASAYITGISVGILLRSPAFWPYALCAAALHHLKVRAARSRTPHLEPFELRHLRHAVSRVGIRGGAQHSMGQQPCVAALSSGCWARSFCGARSASTSRSPTWFAFFLLALLRAHITGDPWQSEVAPITGPEYQLFMFFMITDPRTTVRSLEGAMRGRRRHRRGRDAFAARPEHLRAALRALPGRAAGVAD